MRVSSVVLAATPRLRLAIVGAGPAGLYAASRVLAAFPPQQASGSDAVRVHVFERLPTPHGLVRYGVAPDHPDVKNVENKFDQVAHDPRLSFFGNVNVVHQASAHAEQSPYPHALQLPLSVLSRYYTHILFTYGASQGRPLGIPGSARGELSGVHTALDFVNWYNGHPAAHDPLILRSQRGRCDLGINLADGKRHLTVVGAGNVALDVARIVLRSSTPFLEPSGTAARPTSVHAPGLASLAETDVPEPVLAHLASSKVSRVDLVARRGPAQLAFTNKELREMMALDGVAFSAIDKPVLDEALVSIEAIGKKTEEKIKSGAKGAAESSPTLGEVRVRKRLISLLEKGSKTKMSAAGESKTKSWAINFFRSPAEFMARADGKRSADGMPAVGSAKWNITSLSASAPPLVSTSVRPDEPISPSARTSAWGNEPGQAYTAPPPGTDGRGGSSGPTGLHSTGQMVTTDTDMIVSSVGYRSEPLWEADSTTPPPSAERQSPRPESQASSQHEPLKHLPFDVARSIVPNQGGRVTDASGRIVSET
ncbi:NADPH-adrenodoxin reductase [Thecaphora frezii]